MEANRTPHSTLDTSRPNNSGVNPVGLITGASRGIGRGIALELAGAGYDLVINFATNSAAAAKTAQDCETFAKKSGHSIHAAVCQADIGFAAERIKLIEET